MVGRALPTMRLDIHGNLIGGAPVADFHLLGSDTLVALGRVDLYPIVVPQNGITECIHLRANHLTTTLRPLIMFIPFCGLGNCWPFKLYIVGFFCK